MYWSVCARMCARVCIHMYFSISRSSHARASLCPVFWSEACDVLAACLVRRLSGWFDWRADGDGVGVMKWVWEGFAAGGPSSSHYTGHYGEGERERESELSHHLRFFWVWMKHNSKHFGLELTTTIDLDRLIAYTVCALLPEFPEWLDSPVFAHKHAHQYH